MPTDFELDPAIIHLNHAAVGPWPVATARAVKAFADENARSGSRYYADWMQLEQSLRDKLARLINAPSSDDIALLKSTSEGLSFIAQGLQWKPGDNVVIPQEEFPSNRLVWESLRERGVDVRRVSVYATASPEQDLLAAFDQNTRLLSVSSVQYARGLRLDMEALGAACKQRQVLFCIDAIQSLGALRFDAQAAQADFVVADGHKWMLSAEGLALFYCRAELRDSLQLHEFGWHMVEKMGEFDAIDWTPAASARRFECGSPNMIGVVALNASLELLFEVGLEQVELQVLQNAGYLYDALSRIDGIELLSPADSHRRAGIVTFRAINCEHDCEALYQHLQQQGVICALRGGGIRLSPHFHTRQQQLEQTIEILEHWL